MKKFTLLCASLAISNASVLAMDDKSAPGTPRILRISQEPLETILSPEVISQASHFSFIQPKYVALSQTANINIDYALKLRETFQKALRISSDGPRDSLVVTLSYEGIRDLLQDPDEETSFALITRENNKTIASYQQLQDQFRTLEATYEAKFTEQGKEIEKITLNLAKAQEDLEIGNKNLEEAKAAKVQSAANLKETREIAIKYGIQKPSILHRLIDPVTLVTAATSGAVVYYYMKHCQE